MSGEWLVIGLLIAGMCGAISASIAASKGLDTPLWFVLGCVLGVIGVLIVLCARPVMTYPPGWYPQAGTGQVRWWDGRRWI